MRWTTAGVEWTGPAALAVAALWGGAGGEISGFAKSLVVARLYAGDRTARAILRRRLR